MSSFTDKINESDGQAGGFAEQIASYGIKGKVKDFNQFKENLIAEFSGTPQGQGMVNFLNGEELKTLFNQRNVKSEVRRNVGSAEADRIYGELDRGEVEIQRTLPKGQPTTPRQIKVIKVKKDIKAKSHVRAGKTIRPHNKGYSNWTPMQNKFIAVRKARKISPKKIISEYNETFKDSPRSEASIRTKIYRI